MEYDCPGAYGVPINVQELYPTEWRGWDDFLGVPLTFVVGRSHVHAQSQQKCNISTKEEYMDFVKQCTIEDEDSPCSRLPVRPDLFYKDEWMGWDDWLGVGIESGSGGISENVRI